ncbi:pleiotropic drug resistance protein [Trifolium pratense]|uniref:Pleiotropic drug resistance protein n=1 Tax=Trifolium pratense TaxID=57577 RepID=A0A2K3NAS7_TRIPR|nr:pleiotropic drug resistance protein [Trifolium pratense]
MKLTFGHTFFVKRIQGLGKIKDGCNPATWMLEVTSSAKEMEMEINFAEVYKSSELYRRNKAIIEELSNPYPGSKCLYFPSKYSRSFFTQCMACLWKQHWSYWRNPLYNSIRFIFTIAVALLLGGIYWKVSSKIENQKDFFNAMGFLYTATLVIGVKNCNSVQPLALIEVPYNLVQAVVYGIMVYSMLGYEWSVTKFLWYIFFMFFTFLYSTYFGMMTTAMAPNLAITALLSSAFNSFFNLFSGFLIPQTVREGAAAVFAVVKATRWWQKIIRGNYDV